MSIPTRTSPIEATRNGLFARLQIADLDEHGHFLIPKRSNLSVIVEIGASDADTLDRQVLVKDENLFLVTCEPLIDKYARGLARSPRWAGHLLVDARRAVGMGGHAHPPPGPAQVEDGLGPLLLGLRRSVEEANLVHVLCAAAEAAGRRSISRS